MRSLNLGGQTFNCIDQMPVGLFFDLAEAPTGMASLLAFRRVLDVIVVEEDQERLKAAFYAVSPVILIDDLAEALAGLMTEYAGRPTERPSSSLSGSKPTGKPSRVVSLSRAKTSANGH